MAEYRSAFQSEAQTGGAENGFGIVPLTGAFSMGDKDILSRLATAAGATTTIDPSFLRAASAFGTEDELLLMQACQEDAGQRQHPQQHEVTVEQGAEEAPATAAPAVPLPVPAKAARQHKKAEVRLKPLKDLAELDARIQAAEKGAPAGMGVVGIFAKLMERYGVAVPTVTVEYRDLTVTTDALVGSAALPSVGNSFMALAQVRRMACA